MKGTAKQKGNGFTSLLPGCILDTGYGSVAGAYSEIRRSNSLFY